MELILSIAGSALSILLMIVIAVIAYTHKDQINQLREKNKEADMKIEKLDTQFRILENDKFNELMGIVSDIKTDVALIKQKIEIK